MKMLSKAPQKTFTISDCFLDTCDGDTINIFFSGIRTCEAVLTDQGNDTKIEISVNNFNNPEIASSVSFRIHDGKDSKELDFKNISEMLGMLQNANIVPDELKVKTKAPQMKESQFNPTNSGLGSFGENNEKLINKDIGNTLVTQMICATFLKEVLSR
ncbi:MAG: hypothetical protein GY804_15260 [Alphaproteobacteria bacterium]|nr:hypothetical protein [Alphaproteobacteria bacterium]